VRARGTDLEGIPDQAGRQAGLCESQPRQGEQQLFETGSRASSLKRAEQQELGPKSQRCATAVPRAACIPLGSPALVTSMLHDPCVRHICTMTHASHSRRSKLTDTQTM